MRGDIDESQERSDTIIKMEGVRDLGSEERSDHHDGATWAVMRLTMMH